MIRVFNKICKCFRKIKNKNDYQLYMSFYNNNDNYINKCPCCGSPSTSFHKDGSYNRDFICREEGTTICHRIKVKCMECDSCGHSHALLPSVVLPHSSFGFHFVICLLYDYITHNYSSVVELCSKYDISISTLYRIYKRFLQDKLLMLGLMDSVIQSTKSYITSLYTDTFETVDVILCDFFDSHGYSFMQPKCKIRLAIRLANLPPGISR